MFNITTNKIRFYEKKVYCYQ
ncbi:hypothetical protein [Clostridium botulinum]|nr:hypothetical protein [Clostridium botulinum]